MNDNAKITLTVKQLKELVKENFLADRRPDTSNRVPLRPITETNAKRLLDRHTKGGYVILSACRGFEEFGLDKDNPQDQEERNRINKKRSAELLRMIEQEGLSYTPAYGGFIEGKGTDGEEIVYERSFIVYPKDKTGKDVDFGRPYDFAIEAAKKFNQDSVLIKRPGENAKYITQSGDPDFEFTGNVIFDDIAQQYFTDLHKNTQGKIAPGKRSTRFTYVETFLDPEPQCYSERHVRHLRGEVF